MIDVTERLLPRKGSPDSAASQLAAFSMMIREAPKFTGQKIPESAGWLGAVYRRAPGPGAAELTRPRRGHERDRPAKLRFAADSALEGGGFELSVPQQIRFRFRESSAVSHDGLTVS